MYTPQQHERPQSCVVVLRSVSDTYVGYGAAGIYDFNFTRKSYHVITFRVSRRRREMYCGHARLCVCVCVCVCPRPHAYTIARTRM